MKMTGSLLIKTRNIDLLSIEQSANPYTLTFNVARLSQTYTAHRIW